MSRIVRNGWVLVLLALTISLRAEEWPKWRGPQGDGITRESGLMTQWPEGGPKKLWSAPVGIGHSSPVAVDGKVYIFSENEDQTTETLDAFDAASGKKIWSQTSQGAFSIDNVQWRGTRATPTIVDDKIYTYGGSGDLIARQLADGKEIWRINILKSTGGKELQWGEASSPLIEGEVIYVQGGRGTGAAVAAAVGRADGKIIWQSDAKGQSTGKAGWPTGGGYAHPILIDIDGQKQLIVLGGDAIYAMNPKDGKTIWNQPWETSYDVNATTPIFHDSELFISSGYNHGSELLKLTATGPTKVWEEKSIQCRFPGIVLDRGVLYVNSEQILKAADWATGKILWEEKGADMRIGPGGSFARFGDYLIIISERGTLTLAKATAEGFSKISQVKHLTEGTNIWATPVIYHGKLYIKGVTELLCFDISAGTAN
jgi:outer membrane protein assembly factor BamB